MERTVELSLFAWVLIPHEAQALAVFACILFAADDVKVAVTINVDGFGAIVFVAEGATDLVTVPLAIGGFVLIRHLHYAGSGITCIFAGDDKIHFAVCIDVGGSEAFA